MCQENIDLKYINCYNNYGDNMKKIAVFFSILIVLIISILLYSRYIGTKGLIVNEKKIVYKELNNDFYGIKIAHISDIHYKRTTNKEELEEVVKKINLTKPDIVVLTGDLLEENMKYDNEDINELINILSKIEVNINKYAIKGDCDNEIWNNIITSSGFIDLNNKYDLIYTKSSNSILISGISSNIIDKTSIEEKIKPTLDYLNSVQEKPNYNILLMHEPDFIDKIDLTNFNLVLAGHSLNGQVILPFIGGVIKPIYASKYYGSYYKIKNTDIFISSGIGTYKYSFRLFNHPSFNFYRITKK